MHVKTRRNSGENRSNQPTITQYRTRRAYKCAFGERSHTMCVKSAYQNSNRLCCHVHPRLHGEVMHGASPKLQK